MGGGLTLIGALGLVYLHHWATDFPREPAPLRRVDADLVARLRAQPGLHLPLDPDYELATPLDLEDDPLNRQVYGTRIDLRERRERAAIHIQVKGELGAIHADATNPKAGAVAWLIHATVDVPFTELVALLAAGLLLMVWPARPERAPGAAVRAADDA